MRRNKGDFSTAFGLWLIIAVACAYLLFTMLLRVCDAFIQGNGRYCPISEAQVWLLQDGGWWKALIAATLVGLIAYFTRNRQTSGNEKSDRDKDSST